MHSYAEQLIEKDMEDVAREGKSEGIRERVGLTRFIRFGLFELTGLRGEYEYVYSWGRPTWNIISYFRGYLMILY